MNLAVEAANKAFKIGAPWRKSNGTERAALMLKLAELMERDLEQLAALESLDNGKSNKLISALKRGNNLILIFSFWFLKVSHLALLELVMFQPRSIACATTPDGLTSSPERCCQSVVNISPTPATSPLALLVKSSHGTCNFCFIL